MTETFKGSTGCLVLYYGQTLPDAAQAAVAVGQYVQRQHRLQWNRNLHAESRDSSGCCRTDTFKGSTGCNEKEKCMQNPVTAQAAVEQTRSKAAQAAV
jgi:hypothetical protein